VRLRIDPELCAGHGRCYSLAPEVFDCDDFGHGTVINEEIPDELSDRAQLGVANCPEGAISAID
jgi:ferredoxin